jgi:tetratricopeptide (TPR) repeat protein
MNLKINFRVCFRRAVIILLAALPTAILSAVVVKAQPGGCYDATWRAEYCREERTAAIKSYQAELSKIGEQIRRAPRVAENYYRRGQIYVNITSRGLSGEFDGAVYFAEADAQAFADFTAAARLDPMKPQYFAARARMRARYWNLDLSGYSYLRSEKYKPDAEIIADIGRLLLDNENYKAAEKDFLQCFALLGNRLSRESQETCNGYVQMRQTRAYWLGAYPHVAALIGKTKMADAALADLDFAIEAEKVYSQSSGRDSSLTQVYLVDKARNAVRFGRDDTALATLAEAEKLLADNRYQVCQIYSTRAAIFLRQKRIDLALKDADSALAASGYWICQNMLEVRGDIYRSRGEIEKALEDYSNLLKTDSTLLGGVYWKRGKIYLQTGEYEKAVADFTAAIGYGSLCEKDYELRAKARRLAGDEEAAAEDDKKALETKKRQKDYQPSSNYCAHHEQ